MKKKYYIQFSFIYCMQIFSNILCNISYINKSFEKITRYLENL